MSILKITSTGLFGLFCLALAGCGKSPTGSNGGDKTPIENWKFNNKPFSFKSGVAGPSTDFDDKVTAGVTVYLSDKEIDCATARGAMHMNGWVEISFPDLSIGSGRVMASVGYWPMGPGEGGNIVGQASGGLTAADTETKKEIAGWVNFHSEGDEEWGQADVSGTFKVPYCPNL